MTRFLVCNPLMKTFLKIPHMSSIPWSIRWAGIMEGDAHSGQSYKVVAVGRSHFENFYVVEIYDSTYKSWRIAGHLLKDLQVIALGMLIWMGMGMTLPMVFCDSSF